MSEGRRRASCQSNPMIKRSLINNFNPLVTFTLITVVMVVLSGCGIVQKYPVTITSTPIITPGLSEENFNQAPFQMTPVSQLTRTPVPKITEKEEDLPGVCGRKDAMTLLLLGIDENSQADAIRLIRIDFGRQEVNMVAIPRDFYIHTVGFEDYGIEYSRINATFGFGQLYLGKGKGAKALAENIAFNFGIQPTEQYVLHFQQISDYIDAIGGISVYLDKPASDGISTFPSGLNQMEGDRAVIFMRMRQSDSDFERIRRQTTILDALLDKLQNGLRAGQVSRLIAAMFGSESSQSSLNLKEMNDLYCFAKQVEKDNIHVHEIPSDMYHVFITSSGGWVLMPHEEVLGFLQESLNLNGDS